MSATQELLNNSYRDLFGTAPDGIWGAPGRVNLIGEHTDYNDGFVLPFALDRIAVVAAGVRPDRRLVLRSLELDSTITIELDSIAPGSGWADYLAGVWWALDAAGYPVGGANLVLTSDVPLGAGLSSSAAIECAVVAAFCDLFELDIAPMERAKLAQRAENDFVGAPTGLLDQAASTLCEAGYGLFLDCRSLEAQQVHLPLRELGLELLVLDTKTPHSHVDGEYGQRRATCEAAAQALGVAALRDIDVAELPAALGKLSDPVAQRRVRHVVTENARVLQAVALGSAGDLTKLGPLLDESHASMRDDYEITVETVDVAVQTAKSAGALGARMTGGGFGGCIIALAETGRAASIAAEIEKAFAEHDFAEPQWFVAFPEAGARRLG